MLNRLRFVGLYWAFWLIFFEIGRMVFLIYEWRFSPGPSRDLLLGVPLHGFRMDASLALGAALIPTVLIAQAGFISSQAVKKMIWGFTFVLAVFVSFAIVADLELFAMWGARLDLAPLAYLTSPHEAVASARSSPLVLLLILAVTLVFVAVIGLKKWVFRFYDYNPNRSRRESVATFGAALIIALLVSLLMPLNQSSVYFSRNQFANEAAINPVWNLFGSIILPAPKTEGYRVTDDRSAQRVADSLLERGSNADRPSAVVDATVLRVRSPNVILIIWEGLTAKIVDALGGRRGITPNLSHLVHEGILFEQFYASGYRTPIGLAAILSGFPSEPMTFVTQSADKVAGLPCLPRTLGKHGYHTAFYYGGDADFVNINRYLRHCDYEVLVSRNQFPSSARTTAWGAPDHLLLDRVLASLPKIERPFFAAILTQSSHEPFDVPMPTVIAGSGHEQGFLNSQVYTDRSVAQFIAAAKKQSWWDSTLIIITADHGSPFPRSQGGRSVPEQYRIPMLWLGGALAVKDTIVRTIASQTDFAPTLLNQLGSLANEYQWGRDILSPTARDFAYYAFPNGFGFIDSKGSFIYDNIAHRVVGKRGNVSEEMVLTGRAYQQAMVRSYERLGRVPSQRQ